MKKKSLNGKIEKDIGKSVISWHLFIVVNVTVTLHNLSGSLLFCNQVSKLCLLKKNTHIFSCFRTLFLNRTSYVLLSSDIETWCFFICIYFKSSNPFHFLIIKSNGKNRWFSWNISQSEAWVASEGARYPVNHFCLMNRNSEHRQEGSLYKH